MPRVRRKRRKRKKRQGVSADPSSLTQLISVSDIAEAPSTHVPAPAPTEEPTTKAEPAATETAEAPTATEGAESKDTTAAEVKEAAMQEKSEGVKEE